MKNKRILIIVIGIVILGTMLRLWQLGNVPPSPDWDEAALGYNAYSLLHTGRDEFGRFLPVVLQSFDDYKPALYAYLTVPSVLIFGLTTFAVRLPSAIFGTIGILAVFFLVRELFSNYKFKDHLSLLASFFFAISPWSLQFSRIGFEANVGQIFNLLVVLFFVKGLKKPWLLLVSALFAGLNLYAYQSEKVFTPILVLGLVLIFKKTLFALNKKYILSSIILGVVIVLPMMFFILTDKQALLRVTGTSIFSNQNELLKPAVVKLQRDIVSKDKVGMVLDNRRFVYVKEIISGYVSHFDANWLFIKGDNSTGRHHAPGMGLLYLFELPFVLIGIYKLLFGEFDKKTKLIIFTWFLIAPIPASITSGVPHGVRTLNFLPIFQIFSALGLLSVLALISNFKFQIFNLKMWKLFAIFYLLFAVMNVTYYLNQYFVQQNYYYSVDWQYGYQEAVKQTKLLENKYQKIVVSNRLSMDQSYMFFLFYWQYPPLDYQKQSKATSNGFDKIHTIGKYEFRAIDWSRDLLNKKVLYVTSPEIIPRGANIINKIYNLNGSKTIVILD